MRKYLFTILILTFLGSCVSLEEERILLNEQGSVKGDSLEKALTNPENGVHYVFVDTTDKELLIRYEGEVAGVNFIPSLKNRLAEEQLLFVPAVDTTIVSADTITADTNVVIETQEKEVVEEVVTAPVVEQVTAPVVEVAPVVVPIVAPVVKDSVLADSIK